MPNEKHKHPTEGIQQYPGREETIMKNNPFTRFLSVALTAAMLVGVMPGAVLADAGEAIVGASSAVVESIPESTTPADAAPVATEVPPVTEPEATPEAAQPEASPEAEATPEVTQEPEATPEATEQPEATPEATEEPEATPEATQEPEATPEATEKPETVEGVYNGMAADDLFNAFLACQSVADVDALLANLTDEDLNAFAAEIGEESMNALEAHFQALLDAEEPEEEPAEEELPEDEYVEHVPEIVEAPQPVVPFTNAVPMFSSTLTSVVNSRRSMMRSALLATPNSDDSDDVIPDNGLQMRKWVEETAEGQYTVNLEVWTEGTVTSSTTTKPLDIVLVLDQSGSMAYDFTSVVYTEYTNQTVQNVYNSYRNNTYVQLDDSSYSKVTINYTPVAGEPSYEPVGNATNSELNQQKDKLYYYENGQYYRVSVEWSLGWFTIDYTYSANGKTWTASGRDNQPGFEAAKNFFYASTEYIDQYAFTYTDKSGQNQTVYMDPYDNAQQSFGQQTSGRKLYYTKNGGAVPRLDALATAVDGFIASVAEKAKGPDGIAGTEDDVSHRIAIAGFSSSGYTNTELLTGVTVNQGTRYSSNQPVITSWSTYYYPDYYAYNGPQYYRGDSNQQGCYAITTQDYKNSLQDVSTSDGLVNVQAAVDYLTAQGGTQTDAGMDMANKIFYQNPINEEERDRVVIVFTDGIPTGESSSYNSDVAEKAIGYANTAKTTHGADVYAIGIFEGADATSAGDKYGNETKKGNYFMQNLSSNNGTPQSPSYYLSASNSSELNAVFEAISETTGSSRLDLDEATVVKDVLTQYFTVPNGADTPVDIYTQTYNGTEFTGRREEAEGVTATVDPKTGEISVTGFDFSTHFISENGRDENNPNAVGDYHGEKLIISFPIVPKEEFWGGNKVPTNNTDASGVFDDNTLVENFPVPDPVDVPLKEISLTAQDRNIYYGNTAPTAADLVNAIDQPNDWRTDYVNRIEYQVQQDTIKNTEDGEYSVTAVLSSKEEGKYGPDIADPVTANVYVYTPVITWQDTTQQAGTDVDPQFAANKAGDVIWKHGETFSTAVPMQGTEPTLTYTFATAKGEEIPETFTEELHIKVTAVRNEEVEIPLTKVQFDWAENEDSVGCLTSCEDPNPDFQFRIHIPTTTLTLTKEFVDLTTEDVYYLLFGQKGGTNRDNQFSFDVNYCYGNAPVSSENNSTEWERIKKFATQPDGSPLSASGGDFKVYPTDLLNHEGLPAANLTDEELTKTSNPALGASLAKNASGNWVYTQVLTVPICAEGCYYTVFEQHAELPGYAKQGAASTNWTVTFTDGQDSLSGKGKAVSTNSETIDDGPVDEDELFKNDTFHKLNVKQPVTVSFTNRYTGNMTITKLVSGLDKEDSALVANKEYTIEISPADPEKLKDSGKSGPAFDGKTFTLRRSDGTTETVTFRDGKATVKLKAGETITLEKMPAIQYKVVEVITNTNGEMNLDGYNFVNATYAEVYTDLISGDVDHWNRYETGDTTGRTNTDDQIVAVDVNQTTTPVSKVTVTNTYEVADGVLIINKIVNQFANNGKPVFDFKVTSQEEDGTVYYFHIDMTGKAEGEPEQVVEITLPAGTYKVEELSNQNYTRTNVEGLDKQGQVEIGGEEDKEVTFTNEGKNTNIPTDGSAAVNTLNKVNGNYILSFKKEDLGGDSQTPAGED